MSAFLEGINPQADASIPIMAPQYLDTADDISDEEIDYSGVPHY